MIISLEEAQKIFKSVTQDDLDGLEIAIRELTNNPFQNTYIRHHHLSFSGSATINVKDDIVGLRKGNTIQISDSKINDGLFVVKEINGRDITVEGEPQFFEIDCEQAVLTKVEYPPDILLGVKKLIQYDSKMVNKMGLKSKTVSRMSETYYDQNSGETINGYPAAMMSFINKYKLLKW